MDITALWRYKGEDFEKSWKILDIAQMKQYIDNSKENIRPQTEVTFTNNFENFVKNLKISHNIRRWL